MDWFNNVLVQKIDYGIDTSFWCDPWLEGETLCERFNRLFELASNKKVTIAYMVGFGWDLDGGG